MSICLLFYFLYNLLVIQDISVINIREFLRLNLSKFFNKKINIKCKVKKKKQSRIYDVY